MKPRFFALSVCLAFGAVSMMAQRGIDDGSKFGHGEDSVRCLQNISLFESYGKSENWADALPAWEVVYKECPASRIRIYIYGAQIIKWQLENEKDPAKKQALVDKLMQLYDDRAKYFGDDDKYPAPWILGQKAVDYITVMGAKADEAKAYGWLKQSVQEMQGNSNPQVLHVFMQLSDNQYRANKLDKEKFIQDYLLASKSIDGFVSSAQGAMLDYAKQVQAAVGSIFANSGAADCATLQNLMADKIVQNKDNIEFLRQTIQLLRKVGCTEIDAYFVASNYAHKIEPTAESAAGLAKQAFKKDDMDQAIIYFDEATNLSTDSKDKADFQYNIAAIYKQKGNVSKARQYALKSAEYNKSYGDPYILIARMYAETRNLVPSDPVLSRTVFYAAVDKLEQAKRVDSSVTNEANSLIGAYRAHYPSMEDVFMHSDLEKGATVTVGGWIQERTVVR